MPVRSWVRKLFARPPARPFVRPRTKLAVEALEDRAVPATFAVTSLLDDGSAGTLRWAVGQANSTAGTDLITFAPGVAGGTIVLTGGQLALTDSAQTTIDGGTAGVKVLGNSRSTDVFQVSGAAALAGLTITNGNSGVYVFGGGSVALSAVTLTDNYNGVFASGGSATLTGTNIVGNSGYAVYVQNGSAAVTNTTLGYTSRGVGVFTGGSAVLTNTSVVSSGIGVEVSGGSARLTNTLVVGSGSGVDVSGPYTNGGGNLIGVPAGYTLRQVVQVGGNGLPLPANNGGPTQTFALVPGSPAIGAGVAGATTTDQRGQSRNASPDIGAFETQAPTVAVSATSSTYTGGPITGSPVVTVTGVGGAALSVPAAGTVTYTYATADGTVLVAAPTDAGSYTITATFRGTGYRITSASAGFTIGKANPTLTIIKASATYSGSAYAAAAILTGANGAMLNAGAVTFTYYAGSPAAGAALPAAPINAGTYTVVASFAGSANYAPATATTTFTISPTVVVVTADADPSTAPPDAFQATYGDADPALTYTAAGLVGGDGFTGALARDTGTNAGTYAVTLGTLSAGPNYIVVFTGTTLAITPRAATWTTATATKTYGDADPAPLATGFGDGFLAADGVAATYARAAGEAAGGYAITATLASATLTPELLARNYIITNVGSTFTITPRVLTVTATAGDKVYDGGTAASATLTLGNAVAGEVPAATYTSATFGDKNAGVGKGVTVSGIALDPAFAANYTLNGVTTAPAVASITAKAIAWAFTAADKVYDGGIAATVLTRSLGGVLGQDAVTLTGGIAAFADKNAGANKPVSLTGAALTGADAANYTLTGVAEAAAAITPRVLTVTATAADKVYDGTTAAAATVTIGNAAPGEAPTATFTSAAFGDKNAGTGKAVAVSGIALDPAFAANYTLNGVTTASAAASVTAKAITGAFTAADKGYDGTRAAAVLTRSLGGVIGQDAVALTGGTATFGDKNAGTGKTVTLAGATLTGTDAANYTLTGVGTATAGIAKRALTITATGTNKVFDGTTAATVTLADNRVVGDQLALGYTSAAFADPNVGTGKSVTVTGISVTGADAANYTFNTSATTTASITPAAVTIGLATDRPVAVPGLAVTFTATVAAANGAPVTGTVTFKDGGTVLGTASVVNGKAVLTTDAFQYGNKTITATFAGGASYAVPTAPASVGVSVVPAAILSDPVTGQNALFVGGTAGDDEIEVLGLRNNRYAVEVENGCWEFDQTLTGAVARLVMYGGAGNDAIVASGDVRVPVFAFGGAGNDILVGTAGAPNVLVGGAGNDLLYAGRARDILIGGAGSDLLFGWAGDDMLIGGSTAFDANESALWGLQAEWNSARDLGTRVANLRGTGTGPRANGNAFLVAGGPAATVFNDGAGDFLYGSSGRD